MKISHLNYPGLIALILFCIPAFVIAQEITFTFNPPDSTESASYSTGEKIEISMGEKTVTNNTNKSNELYYKTDSNFVLSSNLISTETYIDGEKQEKSRLSSLVGMNIKYIIGFDGQLDSIEGHSACRDSILNSDFAEFADIMPNYYDYEPFFIRIASEWKSEIGNFAGKTFAIGDTLRIMDTVNNIEGTSLITQKIWFAEMREYDGVNCVVIEYENSIDLLYSEMYMDAIKVAFEDPDDPDSDIGFKILSDHTEVKGKEIMDPSTMLTYYSHEESIELISMLIYGGIQMASQIHTIDESKTDYKFKNK